MRADFSPTLAAARLRAAQVAAQKSGQSNPPMEGRSCEWPRRHAAPMARGGIWRALQQIQARHA
jgi:hypothetical protein